MPFNQLSQQSNISDITMDDFQSFLSIKDFCDKHNILWFPIVLDIKQSKEDPNKKEKVLKPIKNECYAHAKKTKEGKAYKSYKPEPTDFDNLSIETIKQRQEFITLSDWIAIDTRFIHQIDIDHDEIDEGYDKLKEIVPYFKSATKGFPHMFIKQEGFKPQSARIQLKNAGIKPDPKNNNEGVELLCGQWSYARWNDEVVNGDKPPYELTNIETMFLSVKNTVSSEKDKKPKKTKKMLPAENVIDNVSVVSKLTDVTEQIQEIKNDDYNMIKDFIENGLLKCSSHESWINTGIHLKILFNHTDALYLWSECSRTENATQNKQNEYEERFLALNPKTDDKQFALNVLKKYARNNDFDKYNLIMNKYSGMSEQLNYESATDTSLAEIFIALYGDKFIFTEKKLYYYNGTYWELNQSQNIIRNQISKCLTCEYTKKISEVYKILSEIDHQDEGLCLKYKKKVALYQDISKIVQNVGKTNNITSKVLDLIESKVEFDENPYLFAFNNVIWDLKEGKIIPPSPDQMISLTTGYDYEINMTDLKDKKEKLMDILKEIFPDESVRNFDLIARSSGLVGVQVQNLIVSNGVGGNGKSILNELMIKSVGNYGYCLSSTCLTQEIKTGPNPELSNLHNKRYVLSSEPPSKKAICSDTMNQITGNTTLPVRGLWESKCETKLKGTFDLDCNELPKFDVVNDAVNRRIRAIPFESRFVDSSQYEVLKDRPNVFPMNAYYKTEAFKVEYRQVLFHILMDYLPKFLETQLLPNPPEKCKRLTADMLSSSDDLFGWFTTNYKKDTTGVLAFSDIYDKYRNGSYFLNLSKKDQREQNRAKFTKMIETNLFLKDCIKRRNQLYNGCQLSKDSIVGWIGKASEAEEEYDEC